MAAGPFAALGEPVNATIFFTILHCKMEKKWAAPGDMPFLEPAKITAHFFSILQCKMEMFCIFSKWLQ